MRGPIQAPILLPFGICNNAGNALRCLAPSIQATPAVQCRATPWAVKPGHACLSFPCHALQTSPSHACNAVPLQSTPCLAMPAGAIPAYRAMPAVRYQSLPCLTMPAVPCRSSNAPGLAIPCLQCRADHAGPRHACQSDPGPSITASPAAPVRGSPGLALPASPYLALSRPHLASHACAGRDLRSHACPSGPI
jgi:hypothetical protein